MMKHPNYDAWWKSRDARKSFYDVRPAVLFVGGLFDAEDCWGAWNPTKRWKTKPQHKQQNRDGSMVSW